MCKADVQALVMCVSSATDRLQYIEIPRNSKLHITIRSTGFVFVYEARTHRNKKVNRSINIMCILISRG